VKYIKLYEQFRFFEGKESSKYDIVLYPNDQKFDKKKKSIILVPGGDKGNPENDYSKIAPSLLDSYNVYLFSWPQNINIKLFDITLKHVVYITLFFYISHLRRFNFMTFELNIR
jgi:hypothetical protein